MREVKSEVFGRGLTVIADELSERYASYSTMVVLISKKAATVLAWAHSSILYSCGLAFGWLPLLYIFLSEGVFKWLCSNSGSSSPSGDVFACTAQEVRLNWSTVR